MAAADLLTCCWPGLGRLWLHGQWRGFISAGIFAVLLNGALTATFIWPDILGTSWQIVVWLVVGLFWSIGFKVAWRDLHTNSPVTVSTDDTGNKKLDLFPRAQTEYLKRNWYEALQLLNELVDENPHDFEARLMVATLHRHNEDFEQAEALLTELVSDEQAGSWRLEIFRERELVAEAREAKEEELAESSAA